MRKRTSAMTTRIYRVTGTGERIELSRDAVRLSEPWVRDITLGWPACTCRRCTRAQAEGPDAIPA